MTNKDARKQLQALYGCRCLLTNIKTNKLQYHHITKKEFDGVTDVENGACLIREIHEWLHNLEKSDIELYHLINDCLVCYKKAIDLDKKELIQQYETDCVPRFKEKARLK